MKKIMLFLSSLLLISVFVRAQQAPPAATQIMEAARTAAKAQHKNIFVLFHATWCGWCKKMDASMADPSCKAYFDKNYVIRHITVKEVGDKVRLDNPGGERMLEQYGGGDSGIPYWLIFDPDGKLLADSKLRKPGEGQDQGQNIGCPSVAPEVDAFLAILHKTSTLTDTEAAAVRERFLKNAPAK